MKKTISFILYLCLGFLLPLLGNISLLLEFKILILIAASAALIYSQPPLDAREAKADQSTDRASFWWILNLSLISIVLPVLEWAYWNSSSGSWSVASFFGLLLIITGILFRYWAIRKLGQYFTATVKISKNQKVITSGPYSIVRHPSYLGAYLAFVGTAVFLESWYSLPLVLLAMGLAYFFRIKAEEQTLIDHFGEEYMQYRRFSWGLFPGIW